MIYFTSDLHMGHANILKYCNRPFNDVHHMNKTLIDNYNSVVNQDSIVYILGDFAFKHKGEAQKYFDRLNGNKFLIKGNHDNKDTCGLGWGGVWDLKTIDVEGQSIVLCHFPMRTWDKSHHGSYHLFGHVHGRLPPYGLSFDVGVDAWNYFPVSFEQVKKKMATLTVTTPLHT